MTGGPAVFNLPQGLQLLLVGLLVASVAGLGAPVPVAEAGSYKLYSCNVPTRATSVPSIAPWRADLDGLNTYQFNDCASGGSFGVGLNIRFMRAFGMAYLVLERPEIGPQSAIGIVRYRTWITAELSGSGAPAFVDEGGWFGPPGGTNADLEPWVSPPYTPTNPAIRIRLRCTAGDCYFDSSRPLQVRGVEVDLYEDVPPTGTIEGGTLIAPGEKSGRATLSFSAADGESGIARVEALLGDRVVASDDLDASSVRCPHTDWNACPTRYAADFAIDTSAVPPGQYAASLRITDAAGNRRLIVAPQSVVVGNRVPSLSGAVLTAGFPGSRTTATTNFGRAVRIRGRLVDVSGRGIGAARISITEKVGTRRRRVRNATTDATGRFSYLPTGNGPSRSIDLEYFARPTDSSPLASRRLRLRVRASSSFRVSLRGVLVRYSGQLKGRPIPRGGKRVYVQGRAAGGAWQRFAVRRTDGQGRFSGRYRLRVRRPGVRLQFRVEIPAQPGYPYLARVGTAVTRVVR